MKPVHIDKQSAVDAALMIIGSAVGAAASAAFLVRRFLREPGEPHLLHRWAQKDFKGDPVTTTGEPRR